MVEVLKWKEVTSTPEPFDCMLINKFDVASI